MQVNLDLSSPPQRLHSVTLHLFFKIKQIERQQRLWLLTYDVASTHTIALKLTDQWHVHVHSDADMSTVDMPTRVCQARSATPMSRALELDETGVRFSARQTVFAVEALGLQLVETHFRPTSSASDIESQRGQTTKRYGANSLRAALFELELDRNGPMNRS